MDFLTEEQLDWIGACVKVAGDDRLWVVTNLTGSKKNKVVYQYHVETLDGREKRVLTDREIALQDFRRLARRYAGISTPMAACNAILNEKKKRKDTLQNAVRRHSQGERLGFKEGVKAHIKRHERMAEEFQEKLQQEPKRSRQR